MHLGECRECHGECHGRDPRDAPVLYRSAVYYCFLVDVTCIVVSAMVAVLAVV